MTTRKRVKGKMPRSSLIPAGREQPRVLRVYNSQKAVMCPIVKNRRILCKSSPLRMIPLCSPKLRCDVKSNPKRRNTGAHQAQGQPQAIQVMSAWKEVLTEATSVLKEVTSVSKESACHRSVITTKICPSGPPQQVCC